MFDPFSNRDFWVACKVFLSLALVGLVALVLMVVLTEQEVRIKQARVGLDQTAKLVALYFEEHGEVPSSLAEATPEVGPSQRLDEWKRAISYQRMGGDKSGFRLRSAGPDGEMHTEDDIAVEYHADELVRRSHQRGWSTQSP